MIGKNCRIHQGVTIGSTSGSTASATVGDNVFIGANTSIIGDVHIANNVAIGANSLVVKDIDEPGTTWGVRHTRFQTKIYGLSYLQNLSMLSSEKRNHMALKGKSKRFITNEGKFGLGGCLLAC